MLKNLKVMGLLLVSFFWVSFVFAEDFNLSEAQKNTIKELDVKYEVIKSIKAKFKQVDGQNNVAYGWFILQKPGLARIEYDDMPIRFIANSNSLVVQDKSADQKSFFPSSASPFGFLLQEDFSFFNKAVKIISYTEEGDSIAIGFVSTKNMDAGNLTLFLNKNTAHIIKWIVLDARGSTTEITLVEPIFSSALFSSKTMFNVQKIKDVKYSDIKFKS
jgi:outer membrane lipoprotein-sorting protein